jgi:hypothetical protein
MVSPDLCVKSFPFYGNRMGRISHWHGNIIKVCPLVDGAMADEGAQQLHKDNQNILKLFGSGGNTITTGYLDGLRDTPVEKRGKRILLRQGIRKGEGLGLCKSDWEIETWNSRYC